jgi:NAD(P)-dependent dehydrogenase (short-subunit alcohol dehydrogenase family)
MNRLWTRVYDEIIDTTETSPLIIQCDLNDLDENKSQNIANVISENMNILDGIIHNAAIIGKMSSIHDFDLKTWNKVINTNLTSAYLLTKYLTPFMADSKNPRVIFTSSGVVRKGRAFWGAYAISKTAVKSLAEILNDELEPYNKYKSV